MRHVNLNGKALKKTAILSEWVEDNLDLLFNDSALKKRFGGKIKNIDPNQPLSERRKYHQKNRFKERVIDFMEA